MKKLKIFFKIIQYIIWVYSCILVPISFIFMNNLSLITSFTIISSLLCIIQFIISYFSLKNAIAQKYNSKSSALTIATAIMNNIYIIMHTMRNFIDFHVFTLGFVCIILNALIAIVIIKKYYNIYED